MTEVNSKKHRVLLFRRVSTGFVGDCFVNPGYGCLNVSVDLATSGRNILPERATGPSSHDLDFDLLLPIPNSAIFAGAV
ncbi:MAG: hypothetical protein M3545_17400 [Acidobacteriota bacterium]|nr:hypothetical protein [Acidobacteriota bacterium]